MEFRRFSEGFKLPNSLSKKQQEDVIVALKKCFPFIIGGEPMEIEKISTSDLIKELESRKGIRSFNCGSYEKYKVEIKRKYKQDRSLVKLPVNYKVLIFTE